MNVILTGGTGTLGSQIIFELLKQENIKTIFLPVRQKNGKSALSRIKTILESAAAPEFISKNEGAILKKIEVLDIPFLNLKISCQKQKITSLYIRQVLLTYQPTPLKKKSYTMVFLNSPKMYLRPFQPSLQNSPISVQLLVLVILEA